MVLVSFDYRDVDNDTLSIKILTGGTIGSGGIKSYKTIYSTTVSDTSTWCKIAMSNITLTQPAGVSDYMCMVRLTDTHGYTTTHQQYVTRLTGWRAKYKLVSKYVDGRYY